MRMREGAPGGKAVTDTNAITPSGSSAVSVVAADIRAATLRFPLCQMAERTNAISPGKASASMFFDGRAMWTQKIKSPRRKRRRAMPLFRSGEETDRGWPAPTPAASYLQMAERLDAGVPILAFCRLGSIRRTTLWLRDHPHQTRQPVRRLDSLGQPRRQSAGLMRTPKTKKPAGFHLAGFVGRTVPEQMSHILSCFSKTACRTFSRATYTEHPTHDHNEARESI